MPSLFTASINALEIVLLLSGCVLLWRQGLSPAARAATAARAKAMPPWNTTIVNFLLFLWLIVCGGLVFQGLAGIALKYYPVTGPALTIVGGGAFQIGMLVGVLSYRLFTPTQHVRLEPALPIGATIRAGVVTLLIALPVLALVSLVWQYLFRLLGITLKEQDLIDIFAQAKSPLFLFVMIVLATVIAPITEELIFRAGVFRYARTRLPRWAAFLLPAILFASLHGNLASFAPLVALGVVLSFAYERTGSIAVAMVAHGLFNLHTIFQIMAGIGF